MTDQFLFFCVNLGSEDFLKEEIRVFYPELTLSYSRKGFITFKNKGIQYNFETISQLAVTFATRTGICLGKASPVQLVENVNTVGNEMELDISSCIIHNYSINTEAIFDAEKAFGKEVNIYSAQGKKVLNLITLGEKEVWFGIHSIGKGTTRYPNGNTGLKLSEKSPSASYLKLAQVLELYAIKCDEKNMWLDFGSAPGGSSLALLDRGCRVWGIDPAKMNERIISNRNYNHFSTPVQDLSQENLPDDKIDWVHVDLNLNPKQGIKEVLRLIKKYNFSIRGIIFTIQIIKMDHVKNIENFEDHFYDWGFSNIISAQVPSHKKEYVVIATKW